MELCREMVTVFPPKDETGKEKQDVLPETQAKRESTVSICVIHKECWYNRISISS